MDRLSPIDLDAAPEGARSLLEDLARRNGEAPALARVLARAPQALCGHLALLDAFDGGGLNGVERLVVRLACAYQMESDHGIEALTADAGAEHVDQDVVAALRDGAPLPDRRLDALARLARLMVRERGRLGDGELDVFLGEGFDERHVLEVVLGVTLQTMCDLTALVCKTPALCGSGSEAPAPQHDGRET